MLVVLCALSAGSGKTPSSRSLPLPVQVSNTASAPVPVALQGTASIGGTVTVANTAAQPLPVSGTVSVSNSSNTPLIVREPVRTPVNEARIIYIKDGLPAGTQVMYTVPAGKMLVITHTFVWGSIPVDQSLDTVDMRGLNMTIPIDYRYTSVSNGYRRFLGRNTADIYCPEGSQITINAFRSPNDVSIDVFAGIDGYLVDAPSS